MAPSSEQPNFPRQPCINKMSTDDATTDSKVSRFFKLPRELRNEIYSLLYQDRSETRTDDDFKPVEPRITIVTPAALPQALSINRQFKSEYEENLERLACKTRTVLVSNTNLQCFMFDQSCPSFAYGTTQLDVKVAEHYCCVWCEGDEFLGIEQLKIIARLAKKMPALKRIRYQLYFPKREWPDWPANLQIPDIWNCHEPCDRFHWWDGECKKLVERFAAAKTLPTLEVSWYYGKGKEHADAIRFCKWTQEDGLQFDLDTIRTLKGPK